MIGIKGNNPSGHCLIASEIIDYVPLSFSAEDNSQHAKKQALDQEFNPTEPSHMLSELSLVGNLVIHIVISVQVEDTNFMLSCTKV